MLGHELAHIANRDALVMSVVGMPGWIMLNVRGGGPDGLLVAVIGLVSQASTLILPGTASWLPTPAQPT